ncbi:unnamed protein product [Caenorhabditis angaria]|uniref:Uncharacterized protein n=1 Tax=Caenorhabditis angaria TaxID=860376 RepID=A0A9P1N4C1_9PELO|nr:unnamed protein product [Caenorhabditis angaria]
MVVGVGLYFVAQFGIINNRYIELAIMSTYLPMPVLSSLTYLVFVRPYREYCKRVFQSICNSKTNLPINSTQTPAFATSASKN